MENTLPRCRFCQNPIADPARIARYRADGVVTCACDRQLELMLRICEALEQIAFSLGEFSEMAADAGGLQE
jgi:hypothetical protein